MNVNTIDHDMVENFSTISNRVNLHCTILGNANNVPIIMLKQKKSKNNKPKLLLASGFHGNEPGGVLAVQRAIQVLPKSLFDSVSLTILPLINPHGFKNLNRLNKQNKDPNRGFCHTRIIKNKSSIEGQILLDNFSMLLDAAQDGFMSLHEDPDQKRFYIYSSSINNKIMGFRSLGSKCFGLVSNGTIYDDPISGGIIYQRCDGSFEDKLNHEGVKFTACVELPGHREIEERVICGSILIKLFMESSL